MTHEERARILAEALATNERCDREAADLAERQAHNLVGVDHIGEREAFLRRRAAHPPSPEPKFDTSPPAHVAVESELLDLIAELVAAGERQDARIETLEILGRELERRALTNDVAEKLADDARKLKAEIATLQRCLDELRQVVSNEARRGSVIDLPTFRYPRDLN